MKKLLKNGISKDVMLVFYGINKKCQRVVFAIMALLMVVANVLPRQYDTLYAEESIEPTYEEVDTKEEYENYKSTTDADFDMSAIKLVEEVESLRTVDSKTFRRADGTYELAMYGSPVHYEENGKLKDIDNSLSLDSKSGVYKNKQNAFDISFPKSLDHQKKISLSKDDYAINWTVKAVDKTSISMDASKKAANNMKELTKINQQVMYKNVMKGVDLEYIVNGNQIKENMILNQYIKDFSMTFEYEVKNLQLIEQENGGFVFVNNRGDIVFTFDQLVMHDHDNQYSSDIDMQVTEVKKDTYQIVITPDEAWMNKAMYPVVIDPSISSETEVSIQDTFVELYDNHYYNHYMIDQIHCYNGNSIFSLDAYINFTMPSFLIDKTLTYANLTLTKDDNNQYQGNLKIYEQSDYINLNDAYVLDELPSIENGIIGYAYINDNDTVYRMDILNSVNKWQEENLTQMPGFKLVTDKDSIYDLILQSSESCPEIPMISIGYLDTEGIKSYWTYNSQDINHAGTGYVSDFTQELYVVRNDVQFETDLQTLGVDFAYSNHELNHNKGYGLGWNVNYNLKLHHDTLNSLLYTIDYTGNRVDYQPTTSDVRIENDISSTETVNCYIAEDGSGNKLYDVSDSHGNYTRTIILLEDGTKLHYDKDTFINHEGYYDEIDNLYNHLTISVNRDIMTRSMVNFVEDSQGNKIEFNYISSMNNEKLLHDIILYTSDNQNSLHAIEKVIYEYDYRYLEKVSYLTDYDLNGDLNSNNILNIDYNANYSYGVNSHFLEEVSVDYVDENGNLSPGENIRYAYFNADKKVSSIESSYGNTIYSTIEYDDEIDQTKIEDHSNRYVNYKFDRYGHTISIVDNEYHRINYQYYDIFTQSILDENDQFNYKYNHRISNTVQPQITNGDTSYLGIENFENGLYYWDINLTPMSSATIRSHGVFNDGGHYLEIYNETDYDSGYAYSEFIIDSGFTTLEIEVENNTNSNEDLVYVEVGDEIQYVSNETSWQKLTFVLFEENDNQNVSIKLYNGSRGGASFDSIKLFETNKQSELTIMNLNPENNVWETGDYSLTSTISNSFDGDTYLEDILGNESLSLQGVMSKEINVDTLRSNFGSSFNSFYIGAWAKRSNENIYANMFFGIQVKQYDVLGHLIEVSYEEEGYTTPSTIMFNMYDSSWQYAHQKITIDPSTVYLEISLIYDEMIDVMMGEDIDDSIDYIDDNHTLLYDKVQFDNINIFPNYESSRNIYDDFGRLSEVLFDDGTSIHYAYPTGDESYSKIPSTVTDRDNQTTYYEIEDNRVIGIYRDTNVKETPVYNENGQMTAYHLGTFYDESFYFTETTSYIHKSQYLNEQVDALGHKTTYETDVITGLLTYIENAINNRTYYEYYDNGLLKRVYNDEGQTVTYSYDEFNNLTDIILDSGYGYHIVYDNGRMVEVKVKDTTLMSYEYVVDTHETDLIKSQTYATDDTIFFEYDEENRIKKISFGLSEETKIDKYEYSYDAYGHLTSYYDVTNDITEYYAYDVLGQLIKIHYDNDDSIMYEYNDNGDVIGIDYDINNYKTSSTYNIEGGEKSWLYHQTIIETQNKLSLTYAYDDLDPMERLNAIQYKRQSTKLFDKEFDYQGFTAIVESVVYDFSDGQKNFKYEYEYDDIGNILIEYYYEFEEDNYVLKKSINYTYDDAHQLIQVDMRNHGMSVSRYDETNQTIYYTYDNKGNITSIKHFAYGIEESVPAVKPREYRRSTGYENMYVRVSGDTSIDVGEPLNLYFSYYGINVTPPFPGPGPIMNIIGDEYPIPAITTCDYSDVDTSTPGYYEVICYAHDGTSTHKLEFNVVITVGTPTTIENTAESSVSYVYDNDWLDQLESYTIDGLTKEMDYDDQGNPIEITNIYYNGTKYDYATLTWEGRSLVGIALVKNAQTVTNITYTYNDQGIRTSKTIDANGNGVEDSGDIKFVYMLSGDVLISEIKSIHNGSSWIEDYQIMYTYDYDGSAIGFTFIDGSNISDYIYVTNIQGDITKIIDMNGNIVVEYAYDAYGNSIEPTGSLASTIGEYQSMRYRGYKYDDELGLYYLNSRYYNPEIGRFINADGMLGEVGQLGTNNMYAYCANNPVMYIDNTGHSWWNPFSWSNEAKIVAGAVIIVALAIATVATGGAAGGVAGFILSGALKGAAIGAVSGGLISGTIGGISSGSWEGFYDGFSTGFMTGAFIGGVTGAASNAIKVGQAAKMWQPGTSVRTGTSFKTMVHHYKFHGQGFGNIVNYSNQASNFAIRNANSLSFVARNSALTPHWTWIGKIGMNGHFTAAGKILTFWI